MASFVLKIFGCQMNVYDGDRLRTALEAGGWREGEEESADAVIFLTCSIRDKAEQKVWSALGRYGERWRGQGRPTVAVLGCMAQRVGGELFRRFPWVRVVSGPRHLGRVPEALESALSEGGRHLLWDEDPRALEDLCAPPLRRENPYRAFVSIAHGCDNFCAYCIVPHVRGRFASRDPGAILDEVRCLVASGVKDVTLVGQNVNSYGTDRIDGWTFPRLLREAGRVRGLFRLRFATNHPKDLTEELGRTLAEGPPLCPALNLPLQAGSDLVLALMNRGYTVEDYAARVAMLRRYLPDVGLTSDLIVGFPGETEEDFRESLGALERFRFDQVHTAAYSPRPGTRAASMAPAVPEEESFRRLVEANALQRRIAGEINRDRVGRVYEILLDAPAPRGEGYLQGRTPQDKVVLVRGDGALLGTIRAVRITAGEAWALRGEWAYEGSPGDAGGGEGKEKA